MTGVSAPKPRHTMSRLGRGVYLIASDDLHSLWVLHRYDEDGTLTLRGRPVVGSFWRAAKVVPTKAKPLGLSIETSGDGKVRAFGLDANTHLAELTWEGTGSNSTGHPTRQAALEAAIRNWSAA